MADLATTYMGLNLENPLVAASCSLSKNIDGIKKLEDAGIGAVILKSLFEEQVKSDLSELNTQDQYSWHPEAYEYISNMGMELGPREYLHLIEDAKLQTSLPIIASLNCISPRWWQDYAGQIAAAGADGLELNIAFMPRDSERTSAEIEKLYLLTVQEVTSSLAIPVSVKLGPYFTSLSRLAMELDKAGAAALTLFNRFYQFDIDIEHMQIAPGYRFSSSEEMNLPLRWIALLSGMIETDLSASTGVHDAAGAIKYLLAGASTVQLCSILYKQGLGSISTIRSGIEAWMISKGFNLLREMRGMLGKQNSDKPELFERLQYIKALVGIE